MLGLSSAKSADFSNAKCIEINQRKVRGLPKKRETLKASEIFQNVWVDNFRSLSVYKADSLQNACTACLLVILLELCLSRKNGTNFEGKQKFRA